MLKKVLKGAYKLAKNILENNAEVVRAKTEFTLEVIDRVREDVKGTGNKYRKDGKKEQIP